MKKIYIIDDDRDIIESVSMILESEGYETGHQLDENNVVENVTAFGPDLIILDVMFPENESAGFDIAREIKGAEAIKDIPIVMLSAINDKGQYAGTFSNRDRDDSFLPVSEFIEKPISPADLLKKAAELIG